LAITAISFRRSGDNTLALARPPIMPPERPVSLPDFGFSSVSAATIRWAFLFKSTYTTPRGFDARTPLPGTILADALVPCNTAFGQLYRVFSTGKTQGKPNVCSGHNLFERNA
jgi:hypothetical protein